MKQIIFFDFDGVIVNTLDIAVAAFQKQYPAMNSQLLSKWFEGNIIASIKKHHISTKLFFSEYGKMLPQLSPVNDIPNALHKIAQKHSIVIVSSSVSTLINSYLAHHGLGSYIYQILGSDTPGGKDAKFKQVAQQNDVSLSNCIFVTDTLGDIQEAHSIGIATIAVTWGFHSQETLLRGRPEAIATTPKNLTSIVQKITLDRKS